MKIKKYILRLSAELTEKKKYWKKYNVNRKLREREENNLPQMKPLFFLYVWLNLTRILSVFKENLVKHIRKRTIQTGRLFFLRSLRKEEDNKLPEIKSLFFSSSLIRIAVLCLLICVICTADMRGQKSSGCLELKNYKEREPLIRATLETNIKKFGKSHPAVLKNQSELARLYQELGQYQKAKDLLKSALKTVLDDYGNKHEETAKLQMRLAEVYLAKGQYLNALKQAEAAFNTNEKILGKHVSTAESCMVLAEVCQELGQYDRAKDLLELAVAINTEVLGADHALVAKSQAELALLHYTLGEYETAETLLELVTTISFDDINEQNINVSNYLSSLASVYFKLKKHEQAKNILEQALEKDLNDLCEDHPKIAQHQTNLSKIYFQLGEYIMAKDLTTSALKSNLKHYGKKHPIVSENYVDLALIYQILEAEHDLVFPLDEIPGFKNEPSEQDNNSSSSSNETRSEEDGTSTNSNTKTKSKLNLLDMLIKVNKASGEFSSQHLDDKHYQNSRILWNRIITSTLKDMHKQCRLLPADERLMYVQTKLEIFDKFYSFGTNYENQDVYQQIANLSGVTKSIGLDYSRSLQRYILQSNNTKLIKQFEEYTAKKKQLSEAYLLTQQELEQKEWNIEAIEREVDQLESKLLKNSRIKRFSGKSLIRKAEIGLSASLFDGIYSLFTNTREVDFIRFNYHNGKRFTGKVMYYALVDGEHFVRLTDEEKLSSLLEIEEGDYLPAYVRSKEKRKQLYNLIWKPLERHVRSAKHVKLSPVNLLHRVDFDVLQDRSGKYLNERFQLKYGNAFDDDNASQQLRINAQRVVRRYKGALLIGNIAYDKKQISQRQEDEKAYDELALRNNTRDKVKPLPGTLEEVKAIQSICRKKNMRTDLLTTDTPTEDTLQYLSGVSPDIIHIATHGFALDPLYDEKYTSGENLVLADRIRYADNPLQRCGLMLYGANETWSKNDKLIPPQSDGIWTGLEVTEMDLSRTRLVVLSACSTGLGSLHNTEGVFGLQRAFKLAGAKQIVVSLWPVDDEITKELMILFYDNLLNERQAAPTALHNAKAEMRKRNEAPHLWAGFILTEFKTTFQ